MAEDDEKLIAEKVDAFFTDKVMELVRRSYTKPLTMEDLLSGEDFIWRTDDEFRAYTQFNLSLYTYLDAEKSVDKNILWDAIWEKCHYYHALLRLDD